MTLKPFLSDQCVIKSLKNDFGIIAETLTFLPLGADIDSSVYKVQAADKSSYFVKLKRNYHDDINLTLQIILYNAGIVEIISPIATTHGKPVHHCDDFALIVYPFIEGVDGFNCNLTNDQWIVLGKALRQVHEFTVPLSIKNQIKSESYSSTWRDAVRSIYVHINAETVVDDEISLKLLAFMKQHALKINHVVDRAEQLAQQIQQQSPEFVLCHADMHAGNVLIEKNGTLFIVDWDQPIMAPKERDLMFIGAGVAGVWNDPREQERFYKGYGKTEINRYILAYYRYERIVEDIAIYSQHLLLTKDGGNERQEMYKHFTDMFEPHNVIEIACKTDNNL